MCCEPSLPALFAAGAQEGLRAPDSVVASASALGIPSTYCLSIGTEGLLGDLRVLASIEIKRKVCVPQDICKSNSSTPSQSQARRGQQPESACVKCMLAYIIASNHEFHCISIHTQNMF